MRESVIRVPDSQYPIIVEPVDGHIVFVAGGKIIADTRRAVSLCEADLAPVLYIPRRDVDMSALWPSDTSRYCPYKGEASYFSVTASPDGGLDGAWTFGMPHWAARAIENHVAFDPGGVERMGVPHS